MGFCSTVNAFDNNTYRKHKKKISLSGAKQPPTAGNTDNRTRTMDDKRRCASYADLRLVAINRPFPTRQELHPLPHLITHLARPAVIPWAGEGSLPLKPRLVQIIIHALLHQQLAMPALFDDSSIVNDHDPICICNRRQPVRDHEGRASL